MNKPKKTTNKPRRKKSETKSKKKLAAVVVKTLPPRARPQRRRLLKAGVLAVLLLTGLAAAPFMLLARSGESRAEGMSVTAPVIEAAPPRAVVAEAPQKQRHTRGKTLGTEPSGITLPADSQTVAPVEDAAAKPAKAATNKKAPGKTAKSKKPAGKKAAAKKPPAKDDDIIEKDAKAPAYTGLMAEAYKEVEKQNFSAAIELYDKALDKNEKDEEAWRGKCDALRQMETPEAASELKKMIERRPDSAPAYAALGQLLAQRGDREEALKPFIRALELDPKNDTIRANLAILHDRLNHDKEALELYKQIKKPPYAIKQRIDSLTKQKETR